MLPSLSLYYFPTDTTCLDMSPEAEVDIRYLLETYREAVGDKFVDLYDKFSSNLNATDDLLIFYFDMPSHVDAQLRELMNNQR